MKNIFFNFFLLIILLSHSCANSSQFTIDFLNVGQGNCTIVYFGKATPILLVDAGSSASDRSVHISSSDELREATFKKQRLSEIGDKIKKKLPKKLSALSPHINVLVSHGDVDHCNWMTDLIDLIKQNLPSLRIRILLGGSEVEYEGAKLKGVQTLANSLRDSAPYNNKIYISEYEGNLLNIPRIECGVSECNILAADTSTSDKNRHSIVLEIKKDDISILLTGDAPGRVINNILQPYKDDPNKKINIFQATHHGADSEGSNSAESFYYLRPEYCVISAGSRRDYGHPRQQMILNALNSPNMQETQIPHFLQYYSDYSFIDSHPNLNEHLTIGRLENDFVIGFTKLGIFSTASQGDIHFEEGSFTFTKGPPLSSLENLETLPLMFDFLQYYTQLGYSSSLLSYKLPHVKFENLEQLIYFTVNLIGNHPNIISCDLSRAEFLDTNFKYEAVLDLVRTLKDVREADFPFSLALDERTKKHIISIWKSDHGSTKNFRLVSY